MANLALITGASSGIGAALARHHAALGGDLILTARRADRLEALKSELEAAHGIAVKVFAADLAKKDAAQKLYQQISKAGLSVDILINNAGFGGLGKHIERPLANELEMIDLNVKALVSLCHAIGGDMAARGSGKILNVGSTAGFLPGPEQAVYFATKAFVNSFSQALDHELRPKGVTCTVLAPGYVSTEFADRAEMHDIPLTRGGGRSAASVAAFGYEAMLKGKLVVVNEKRLGFLSNWVVPLLPRRLALKMMAAQQTKTR